MAGSADSELGLGCLRGREKIWNTRYVLFVVLDRRRKPETGGKLNSRFIQQDKMKRNGRCHILN